MKLPYGWTQDYAVAQAFMMLEQLQNEVATLKTEIARLDAEKANRVGRKKATAPAKPARITEEQT